MSSPHSSAEVAAILDQARAPVTSVHCEEKGFLDEAYILLTSPQSTIISSFDLDQSTVADVAPDVIDQFDHLILQEHTRGWTCCTKPGLQSHSERLLVRERHLRAQTQRSIAVDGLQSNEGIAIQSVGLGKLRIHELNATIIAKPNFK